MWSRGCESNPLPLSLIYYNININISSNYCSTTETESLRSSFPLLQPSVYCLPASALPTASDGNPIKIKLWLCDLYLSPATRHTSTSRLTTAVCVCACCALCALCPGRRRVVSPRADRAANTHITHIRMIIISH